MSWKLNLWVDLLTFEVGEVISLVHERFQKEIHDYAKSPTLHSPPKRSNGPPFKCSTNTTI